MVNMHQNCDATSACVSSRSNISSNVLPRKYAWICFRVFASGRNTCKNVLFFAVADEPMNVSDCLHICVCMLSKTRWRESATFIACAYMHVPIHACNVYVCIYTHAYIYIYIYIYIIQEQTNVVTYLGPSSAPLPLLDLSSILSLHKLTS